MVHRQFATMSLPALLKRVRVLEDAGLVTTVKRGRVRERRLSDDALAAVATWTARQQALWSTRLDALGTGDAHAGLVAGPAR